MTTNTSIEPNPPKKSTEVDAQATAIFAAVRTFTARQLAASQDELAGLLVRVEAALNATDPNAVSARLDALEARLAKLEQRS